MKACHRLDPSKGAKLNDPGMWFVATEQILKENASIEPQLSEPLDNRPLVHLRLLQ